MWIAISQKVDGSEENYVQRSVTVNKKTIYFENLVFHTWLQAMPNLHSEKRVWNCKPCECMQHALGLTFITGTASLARSSKPNRPTDQRPPTITKSYPPNIPAYLWPKKKSHRAGYNIIHVKVGRFIKCNPSDMLIMEFRWPAWLITELVSGWISPLHCTFWPERGLM